MCGLRPCRLHLATGTSCGPTAVGAVTGNTSDEVNLAIVEAAKEDNEVPEHLNDTSFRHQVRAAEILGWDLFSIVGARIQARSIPSKAEIAIEEFNRLPTISEFVRHNQGRDILLGHAVSPSGVSHTFAVDGGWYYDNNVGEKIVSAVGVPSGLAEFRVVRAVALRRRSD
jgi:hypothetical protein